MANHDHNFRGYQLTTFSSQANYIGVINHQNLDEKWRNVRLGGGTRVMTGWQKVKDLHFQKHSESATHHPVYGWQAGPQTPMLRLLLLLDGEATDMDEFELDLLGLSWVHVTIFLIGVDGCPHHHRHANELQRISEVNPLQNDSLPTSCSSGISATRFRCLSSRNWSTRHHIQSEHAMLASRLEDDSMQPTDF
jgi:hypothetical protein